MFVKVTFIAFLTFIASRSDAAKLCAWSNNACAENLLAVQTNFPAYFQRVGYCAQLNDKTKCLADTSTNKCQWQEEHALPARRKVCIVQTMDADASAVNNGMNQLYAAGCAAKSTEAACLAAGDYVNITEKITKRCLWVVSPDPVGARCLYSTDSAVVTSPKDNGKIVVDYFAETDHCNQYAQSECTKDKTSQRCAWNDQHSRCIVNFTGTFGLSVFKAVESIAYCQALTNKTLCETEAQKCQIGCAVPCAFTNGSLKNTKECECPGGGAGGHAGGAGASVSCEAGNLCTKGKDGTQTSAATAGKCTAMLLSEKSSGSFDKPNLVLSVVASTYVALNVFKVLFNTF
eukprot:g3487.t1